MLSIISLLCLFATLGLSIYHDLKYKRVYSILLCGIVLSAFAYSFSLPNTVDTLKNALFIVGCGFMLELFITTFVQDFISKFFDSENKEAYENFVAFGEADYALLFASMIFIPLQNIFILITAIMVSALLGKFAAENFFGATESNQVAMFPYFALGTLLTYLFF